MSAEEAESIAPPTQPAAEAPPPPSPPTSYEFSPPENQVIGNLGSRMGVVGLFMLGVGLFLFASVVVRWIQSGYQQLEVALVFLTLLFMVVGIWTHRAGTEFVRVARTVGNDIAHLMKALENLLKLYTLLYLLFFITLVFAIIQLGAQSL
jgi:hypothetical protein